VTALAFDSVPQSVSPRLRTGRLSTTSYSQSFTFAEQVTLQQRSEIEFLHTDEPVFSPRLFGSILDPAGRRLDGDVESNMHLRFRMTTLVQVLLLVVSLGATSFLAYRIVGFLGIGFLGLIIGVIALTVEMEQGGPVGHSRASNLYADHMAAVERMSASEKAARRAEIERDAFPLLVAKVISAGLILVGFALFFGVQR
jgi:hypothetical protein